MTAASMPPVPEAVSVSTSCCVWYTRFTPSVMRAISSANSGPRWLIISAAPAVATS